MLRRALGHPSTSIPEHISGSGGGYRLRQHSCYFHQEGYDFRPVCLLSVRRIILK